jgi:hypothetical protein
MVQLRIVVTSHIRVSFLLGFHFFSSISHSILNIFSMSLLLQIKHITMQLLSTWLSTNLVCVTDVWQLDQILLSLRLIFMMC